MPLMKLSGLVNLVSFTSGDNFLSDSYNQYVMYSLTSIIASEKVINILFKELHFSIAIVAPCTIQTWNYLSLFLMFLSRLTGHYTLLKWTGCVFTPLI
jgi:hypothetical protein